MSARQGIVWVAPGGSARPMGREPVYDRLPKLPPNMGHHFGDTLECLGCGKHLYAQSRAPLPCPRPMGKAAKQRARYALANRPGAVPVVPTVVECDGGLNE